MLNEPTETGEVPQLIDEDTSLAVGGRRLPSRYFLAPLAGYTHLAFRRVIRELGGVGLATTDLVQSTTLLSGRKRAMELIATSPEDRPLSVQIFGGRVSELVEAAEWLADRGYEGIDINMGCPMAKVNSQGGGARLMCDTEGACEVVSRVVSAVDVPVTVKMRLGWDIDCLNAPDIARRAEAAGAKAITVHGRTRNQFYKGVADWSAVAPVKQAVLVPVLVNGDIIDGDSARKALEQSGADGVMIGRGVYGRPWIASAIEAALEGRGFEEPGAEERLAIAITHFRRSLAFYGERLGLKMFRKHLASYIEAAPWPETPEARRAARAALCRLEDPYAVETALRDLWSPNRRQAA